MNNSRRRPLALTLLAIGTVVGAAACGTTDRPMTADGVWTTDSNLTVNKNSVVASTHEISNYRQSTQPKKVDGQ